MWHESVLTIGNTLKSNMLKYFDKMLYIINTSMLIILHYYFIFFFFFFFLALSFGASFHFLTCSELPYLTKHLKKKFFFKKTLIFSYFPLLPSHLLLSYNSQRKFCTHGHHRLQFLYKSFFLPLLTS